MLVASLPIDSVKEPVTPAPMGADNLQLHYQTTGSALMICEAGSYRVGIPWLPPTPSDQQRVKQLSQPLDEFVRCAFVSVPTAALESYCEDLESSGTDQAVAADLGISMPTFFERYCFSALLFGIFFCTDFLISSALAVATDISLASALLVAAFAFLAGVLLSEERYRRRTFHCVVMREILRRRGLDQVGANGIPIAPVG